VHNAIVGAQIHLVENRAAMAEMLSKDGKGYLPFPKEVVKRAMMLYDIPYPGNAAAIKHKDWGMERINFQGWPYRSATELVVNDLKKTLITGDSAFLEQARCEVRRQRPGQLHLHQEGAGRQSEVEERP
jgi:NitT/TauT family transport system substrate-binding protein